jgi:hypothetical protein
MGRGDAASQVVSAFPGAYEFEVVFRFFLVEKNVRRYLDPGLGAARPDVRDRFEPAGVVERARLERDDLRRDLPPNAALAIGAPPVALATPVLRLERNHFRSALQQFERPSVDGHAHDEGAAGNGLATRAVADVEFERIFEEAIAHRTTGAASLARKVGGFRQRVSCFAGARAANRIGVQLLAPIWCSGCDALDSRDSITSERIGVNRRGIAPPDSAEAREVVVKRYSARLKHAIQRPTSSPC